MSESPTPPASPGEATRSTGPTQVPGGGAGAWYGGLPSSLPAPLGRYQLLKLLGKGGMGEVYLAHDLQLDRQVALKIPTFADGFTPERIERFFREARAAATLSNASICPVYDVGVINNVHFLTMAYVEGRPLSAYIRPDRRQPVKQAVALVRQLALAMQEAHDKGVIHRDLKPANILINAKKQPVIMDFGLARRERGPVEQKLTQSGEVLGTPAYMSPEQVNGDLDAIGPGCDIYALGVILYELLTGRRPFEAPFSGDLLVQIMTEAPRPPSVHRPEVDPALDAICIRALAKKPAGRFTSCRDFAAALQDWLKKRPQEQTVDDAFMETPVAQPRINLRRRTGSPSVLISTAVAACVCALIGLLIWWMAKPSAPGSTETRGVASASPATRPQKSRSTASADAPPPGRATDGRTRPLEPGDKSLANSIGLRLVEIPPGEFWMGSPESEPDRYPDEGPRHKVKITRPFHLGIYEVTQEQYQKVMDSNPSKTKGPKLPVEFVSWEAANEFCRRLSELPAERAAGRTYRLPTEAEWEYACRAGTETAFHVGAQLSTTQAHFSGDSAILPEAGRTVEVGSYRPNAFGLYDMHGNVWERCADWADPDYYSVSPTNDPPGPPTSPTGERILRGGGYDVAAQHCRSANRFVGTPGSAGPNIGFRVACDIGSK